jgi:hypothetical protein
MMGAYDGLLTWCRDQRELMLRSLEMMESGTYHVGRTEPGGKQVDETQHWIAEYKRRVAELESLMTAYEKINA